MVKDMVFPVIVYGYKSWTIEKAECRRIDAFRLWCWEKTLERSMDNKEIKLVIWKENQPWIVWKDWCWNWSSSTLATGCKEWTHWERPWCWERLRARGEGDNRGWDGCMASLTQWTWIWANSGRWWRTGKPDVLQSMGLHNWTGLKRLNNNSWNGQKHRSYFVVSKVPCSEEWKEFEE